MVAKRDIHQNFCQKSDDQIKKEVENLTKKTVLLNRERRKGVAFASSVVFPIFSPNFLIFSHSLLTIVVTVVPPIQSVRSIYFPFSFSSLSIFYSLFIVFSISLRLESRKLIKCVWMNVCVYDQDLSHRLNQILANLKSLTGSWFGFLI